MVEKLIFDIGVGSGQDTYFYLNKGFNVVAVEADPRQFDFLNKTFSTDIAAGRLTIINAVASNIVGTKISFYCDDFFQFASSTTPTKHCREYKVETVDYPTLVSNFGIPYYCKIDIEGEEENFLPNHSSSLPKYISVELLTTDMPIDKLYRIGYKKFKLVNHFYNHMLHRNYVCTGKFNDDTELEGTKFFGEFPTQLNSYNLLEWSGLFGRDLGNEWFTYDEVKQLYKIINNIKFKFPKEITTVHIIYDCHATF